MHNKIKSFLYLLLCSLLVISSCKKKDDGDDSATNVEKTYALTIDSAWSMRARIDGVDYSISQAKGATGNYTNSWSYFSQDSVEYSYGSDLRDDTNSFSVWIMGHQY